MSVDEDLFFLGVTREHCTGTDLTHAIRELATNAIDADPTLPLADSVRLTDTYGHVRAVIVNKADHGLEQDHLLQGPSQKKDDSRFFGGFGCGLKDAMAVFVRNEIEVEILTQTWCGRVIEDVRPCSNPAFVTTKREVCVARRTPTTADLVRLENLMAGAAVAFVLSTPGRNDNLRAAVGQCMLGELGQYSNAPPKLATPDGRWLFKHQAHGTKKNSARLTLRGVYWMDLPMRGCGDLVFDLQRLRPKELQDIGRDRRNLKVSTIAATVARAVKHLVANIDSLPSALRDAVAVAAHATGINSAVSTALEPLRQRASAATAALPTTTVAHPAAPSQPLFQAPVVPPAPLVPQQTKAAKLREAQDEIQRLQRLLTKHFIDFSPGAVASPTGLFMLPANTTDGLTSWAKHHALSEGAQESLETLVFLMKGKLKKLGFHDPVVTGSTARRCALRGESVDLDIAVWVDTQVPDSTDIFGNFVETDDAFVFTPSDGNGVVVHCDLMHKSYRQHPIDVQFFPDEESYKAQIAFMKSLCDGPYTAHAAMLTVALKKWARNVLSVATASSGDAATGGWKVPGWAFEMIAMQAVNHSFELEQTPAGDPRLPPALFVGGLKAVSSPPAAVCTGCDIDGAAFTALKKAAARTIPNYTP